MKTFQFRNHLVTAVAWVILAGCQFFQGSNLSYIREVTKVDIPGHITTISEFDNGEWIAGGKYLIKEEYIKAFLAENSFHPVDEQYRSLFNTISKEDHIPLSDLLHLKYISNCQGANSWVFTINEKSGELWVEVQYPDFGGLGPCE
ncbi:MULTISPECIES: hypothetical protein [Niastella]|uniref:Lipoprotein n=1 Tax=Niastella soli TaxID=2821487 RepID=A0ABS3YPR0_9BACT|nr:hypothetical protein [Niastella soli]MBO9199878.1 hypothetical protein [Niastella soli]